jgi:hypothetical protein
MTSASPPRASLAFSAAALSLISPAVGADSSALRNSTRPVRGFIRTSIEHEECNRIRIEGSESSSAERQTLVSPIYRPTTRGDTLHSLSHTSSV